MNKLQKLGMKMLGINAAYMPGVHLALGGLFTWGFKSKSAQLKEGYKNKIVFATVNVLNRKEIEVPLILSKVKTNRKQQYVKSLRYNFAKGNQSGEYNQLLSKALDEIESHPLIDLLNEPNDYQTGLELQEAFWFNYELAADGYLFFERPDVGRNAGIPVRIHCINADRVTPYRINGDINAPITYYTISLWDGNIQRVYPEDMFHLSKWSPDDPILGGFSPQQSLAPIIEKDNLNDIAQGSTLKNGGTGTIIGSDSIVQDGKQYYKLTKEQKESIEKTVREDWQGAHNAGKIHVTNGNVTVSKLGDTLVDMDSIKVSQQDRETIAAGWGVNSILIGDKSGGTENNVKEAYKALVTNVVVPTLRKFDAKLNRYIRMWFPNENLDIRHDFTEFSELAPDLKLMAEVYGKPNLTEDERRKLFNFDEMDNGMGKAILVPSGLMPLNDLLTDNVDELNGQQPNTERY